jgi:peptidyl-prolyl cis-trans isomerase A (cyclophilin A)
MNTKPAKSAVAAFLLAALLVSCKGSGGLADGLYARVRTAKGDIVVKLEYERAPLTVGNFVGLAEGRLEGQYKGKKYFDGLKFHRVEPGFVVQGGDPNGNGSGGPGFQFPNEIAADLKYNAEGVVGMANAGPDTNGSQFFITLAPTPQLDGGYTIFGKVVQGMDTVKKIAVGDLMSKVEILRVGSAAKSFKADQAAWDSRAAPLAAAIKKADDDRRAADADAIKKRWPDLVADADGIYQKTLKAGSGQPPAKGQTVSVAYKGMLTDGRVFDQSDFHGGPADLQVGAGRLLPGWEKVLTTMRKGEKRMVVLPPELAYGSRGVPGRIPPNSYIAFELELVALK